MTTPEARGSFHRGVAVPRRIRTCSTGCQVTGHVFVLHGDPTKLQCDGFIVPCDSLGNVSRWWTTILDRVVPGDEDGVVRPRGVDGVDGLRPLAPHHDRELTLVDTARQSSSPGDVVRLAIAGLDDLKARVRRRPGRHLPLLALPMLGAGGGGFGAEGSYIARKLIASALDWTEANDVDVAIVLRTRAAFVAVQAARREVVAGGRDGWRALGASRRPKALAKEADRLGRLAAAGDLSLFVGAGISKPLDLPDWGQLLARLAAEAGLPHPHREADKLAAAAEIVETLGRRTYEEEMTRIFGAESYAPGHALLAGLHVRKSVTTNYDRALETAVAAQQGTVRVLTGPEATGHLPWLLKLHGDIARPSSLVLTKADFEQLAEVGHPLYGLVQTLLMTSHVLFVGFAFSDPDFTTTLDQVRRVRAQGSRQSQRSAGRVATALALTEGTVRRAFAQEIQTVWMLPAAVKGSDRMAAAARLLEVFLDRLAFTAATTGELAAEYLLDPPYRSGLNPADRALATSLHAFVASLDPLARDSAGWPPVKGLLGDLGMPPETIEGRPGSTPRWDERVPPMPE